MSRKIKLRAWDTEKEVMYESVGFVDTDCGRTIVTETYMVGGGERIPVFSVNAGGGKRIILMQFTGLHDKSGKEIYEGDIVKDMGGSFGKVYYCEKTMSFRFDINEPYWLNPSYEGFDFGSLEILGNVFEHKHLLEDKGE